MNINERKYNEDALVLVSGGQDSTTCLCWALKNFNKVSAITFKYGQKHGLETSIATEICKLNNVSLKAVDISFMKDIVISNLFDGTADVNAKHVLNNDVPASFVPYRNALFLTIAAGWASTINAKHLVIGVCETDYSGYADCRDVFIRSMEETLNLATDFKDNKTLIHTPLMWLTKAEEFKLAEDLGCLDIVINKTMTCYNGVTEMNDFGMGCGECSACKLRKRGYQEYLKGQVSNIRGQKSGVRPKINNPQSPFGKASEDKSAIRNPQYISASPLGEKSEYPEKYNNSLLFPVSRSIARRKVRIDASTFFGIDVWNCYELSWLNKKGKPEVRLLRIIYSAHSDYIVESKSLKLYLNSFNAEKFDSEDVVSSIIKRDLESALRTKIELNIFSRATDAFKYKNIDENLLIDDIDVSTGAYQTDKSLLTISEKSIANEYKIYSNLLKTNCPVTGQPDWGTVYIKYYGDREITKESLLKYIVSYRNAQDFHEVCCEKMFVDIFEAAEPEKLLVKCYYTRRGGIDINPIRFNGYTLEDCDISTHLWRQ